MLQAAHVPEYVDETGAALVPSPGDPRRLDARKRALRMRHSRVNTEIMFEQQRPLPDSLRLFELKCDRLAIKDELERLEGRRRISGLKR